MSATGRSGAPRQSRSLGLFEEAAADKRYERQAEDFYATPYWATRALIPHLRGINLDQPHPCVLDPFAGEGAIWPLVTAIVTNPPYEQAVFAILRSLDVQAGTPGIKDVAFLLRINFLGAQKRAEFHKKHPSDLYILPRRPQYVCSISCENKKKGCKWGLMIPYRPDGQLTEPKPAKCGACGAGIVASSSDATEYAWFVWGPGRGGRWSILDVEDA